MSDMNITNNPLNVAVKNSDSNGFNIVLKNGQSLKVKFINEENDQLKFFLENADKLKTEISNDVNTKIINDAIKVEDFYTDNGLKIKIAMTLFCNNDFNNEYNKKTEYQRALDAVKRAEILFQLFRQKKWL